jgi:hypothetical protein
MNGAGFGFAMPGLLLLLPLAAAVLIYAYLKRGQGRRVLVSTLLLLKEFKRPAPLRKKFIPPPRFFLELLLLTLLIAAAAGISKKGEEERLALVIDNSFGMSAADPQEGGKARLIDEALKESRLILKALPGTAKVKLFLTSPVMKALSREFDTPAEAAERLDGIETAYAGDFLEAGLLKVSSDSSFDRIIVLSDRPRAARDLTAISGQNDRVSLKTVGGAEQRKIQNIAIGAAFISNAGLKADRRSIGIELDSYCMQAVEVTVKLAVWQPEKTDFAELEQKQVKISSQGSEPLVFEAPQAPAYRVRLELLEQDRLANLDAIKEDDTAYLTDSLQSGRILLIGDYSAAGLGLSKLEAYQFQDFTLQSFMTKQTEQQDFLSGSQAPQALIFHRVAPDRLPPVSSLFVLPPPGNKLITVQAPAGQTQFTRWVGSHPLLHYLNLTTLSPSTVSPMLPEPWTSELISTTPGAVALAGERGEGRYVFLGFEIFPYEGAGSPALSILLLNTLKWLAGASLGEGTVQTYSPVQLEGSGWKCSYLAQGGGFKPRLEVQGNETTVFAQRPGVLLAKREESKDANRYFAVNFFSAQESDTLRTAELAVGALPGTPSVAGEGRQSWVGWLLWIGVAVLAGELVWRLIRALRVRGDLA